MSSYFGITGFVSPSEVIALEEVLQRKINGDTIQDSISHLNKKLMIGVLVSLRSLRGGIPTTPSRYPLFEDAEVIFTNNPIFLNTIHYNSDDWRNLSGQLVHIAQTVKHLHAIQLNLTWPDPDHILEFRKQFPEIQIILQIGKSAFFEVGYSPNSLYSRIEHYIPYIEHILIDMSGGSGALVDVDNRLIKIIADCHGKFPNLSIGIAGGLCAQSLIGEKYQETNQKTNKTDEKIGNGINRLTEYLNQSNIGLERLSIDAEAKLRTEDDNLYLPEVAKYILAAIAVFGK